MSNGGINLASLGFGGIDTSSIVTQLVSIAQMPYNQAATKQQNIQDASSTISSFSSTLSALATATNALSDPSTFSAMGATSSDSSIATTVSGSASPGQWSVSVSSVAQEQRTLSNGTDSSTTALGLSGNLNITLGNGSSASVAVSSTDTLADIAGEISSAGLRVQASLVYDGSQYHLLVSGLDTGAANTVNFDESGLTGSGYSLGLSDTTNNIQSAQNAQLKVGGITISSASNQVTNAIPGVTLAVTQPTTSPATVSIASNPSTIEQNVQAFVTAYNAVINAGHTDTGFGTTAASNTLLQGDSAIRSAVDQMEALAGGEVAGTTGTYTTLDSVGISLNEDGTLSLDTSKLDAALASDPTSVERLFVTDTSNGSQGVMGVISSTINSLTTGTSAALNAEVAGYGTENTNLTTQMAAMQTRTAAYQTLLTNEFTQMNSSLAMYKQQSTALTQSFDSSSSSSSSSVV
ncbi:MAG TPA: flagellar filament capping protein FliD [Polyangiaceae bacterium]|jgi:flagellar hook-associated protein 2